jgi:LmbE family N-acetylglucosaminyl deacetylase
MKFLGFDRALCLSPHPDDVEYSMLGSINKYKDTLFDIFCMSMGGDFDKSTSQSRWSENKKIWESFDNTSLRFSNFSFIKDHSEDYWVNQIETQVLEKQKYDAIFIPTYCDSHFEHKIANNLAPALARDKSLSIVEYRTPSTLDEWTPNLFSEITDFYPDKIELLKLFESQKNKWYFKEEVLLSFHSNYLCHKKGLEKVESFNIKQLLK